VRETSVNPEVGQTVSDADVERDRQVDVTTAPGLPTRAIDKDIAQDFSDPFRVQGWIHGSGRAGKC